MQARAVHQHSVIETLDAVDRLYVARVEAEAASFELAAHFADLHPGEALDPGSMSWPGRERAVRLGGRGTPLVSEFAAAELGARMRMGTWSARRYIGDALEVRHRLPLLWARVVSREARVGSVRLVATRTRALSPEAAAYVDRAMVAVVDGSLPWGRFESLLEGVVVAADPAAAAAREEERALVQFAKRTRSSEAGTAGFYVRSTVGVIARVEATVLFVAEALKAFGDAEDLDARKVKAVVVLCNPTRAVELLAAYAALRARTVDVELPLEDDPGDDRPGDRLQDQPPSGPRDGLDRMDAFARRVGFTPGRLPDFLADRSTASRSRSDDGPPDPDPDPDPDPGPDPGWPDDGPPDPDSPPAPVLDPAPDPGAARFVFDWSALLPPLTLHLHLSAEALRAGGDQRGGVVRWEGEGPVTHRFVHEHLRPLHRYVIAPVVDLAGQAPVDAYEVPDRHRSALVLRSPGDCFPFGSRLFTHADRADVDHTEEYRTEEYRPAGVGERRLSSRLENYGLLGRFHHRVKTHGHWTVRQPFPGVYLWRDPHGQVYLADHTGTHKVTAPGTSVGAARPHDPELTLHPAPDLVLEVDAAS